MSLNGKLARYLYDTRFIDRKTYGIDRALTILIAGAYDTGIIGTEHNGIMIFDDDAGSVVLDQHLIQSSGNFGPNQAQVDEFERLRALSWKDLGAFVKSHPHYSGGVAPDLVGGGDPGRGNIVNQKVVGREVTFPKGKDIRTKEMKDLDRKKSSGYDFPLMTRSEILAFIGGHRMHDASGYDAALAWNIKVHGADYTGKSGPEKVDEKFDPLWSAVIEKNGDIFAEASGNCLRQFLEDEYTTPPGNDEGKYKFHTAGRTGGWLVLSEFDGQRAISRHPNDVRE